MEFLLGMWLAIPFGFIVCAILSANKVKVDEMIIDKKVVIGFIILLVLSMSANVYYVEKTKYLEDTVVKYQEVNDYSARRITSLKSDVNYLKKQKNELIVSRSNYKRAYIAELLKYD